MRDVIQSFDLFLSARNLRFDAVVIGGAALIIMDVVSRKTKDVDCLDPEIPEDIKKASIEFSELHKEFRLSEEWLNNGPIDLKRVLPTDWQLRLVNLFEGKAIHFKTLGRSDLINSKLFACVDRGIDFEDCVGLKITLAEFKESYDWICLQDANPLWKKQVNLVFSKLKKALNYE